MADDDDIVLCIDSIVINLASLLWATLILTISTVVVFKFIKGYYKDKIDNANHSPMNNRNFIISIALIIGIYLSVGIITTAYIGCLFNIVVNRALFNFIFIASHCIELGSIEFMFLSRLYDVFHDTPYAYSTSTFAMLIFHYILTWIFGITGLILGANSSTFVIGSIFGGIGATSYVLLAIVTMGLFVIGLHRVKHHFYRNIMHNYNYYL